MKKILFFIFLFNFVLAKDVSILLDWKYQFEFAGYIAAKEKGFYKDAGLNVKLVEYNNNDIVKDVLNGKYDFGIYDNNLIIEKIKGRPIKLVASIFKRSALILIVKDNINTLGDLEYKTLMIPKKDVETFKNFLEENDIDITTINFISNKYSIKIFIKDKNISGISGFISDEVYELAKRGISFRIINPSDYNFLMYQGELFSSENFVNKNPVLVDKFKKATIKGWEYALNHKKEIINLIYNKYNTQHKSKEALLYEADKIQKIIEDYIYPIGSINKSLLETQFLYYSKKLKRNINLKKMVDEYVFEFHNPLNLDSNYLWLIKLYNFYLEYKIVWLVLIIFITVISIIIYFYLKLKKEKKKIETLFNKAPIGYVLVDKETRVIKQANKYVLEMFGFDNNTNLNLSTQMFHIDETNFYRFEDLINKYIKKHNTIEGFSKNWRFKKRNGEYFWVNLKAVVFSEKEILWIISDIDDIMKITEKLDEQIKKTQRAMKTKEEFLANMSHEIRTPLNAILGFIDIIDKREKDKENKKYLEIIRKSGKQLLTIINDILDFSKIESGKLTIEKIEFNPKEEFEPIVSLFKQQAQEKDITLHSKFINLNYCIIQDPVRIKQVISNLLSNAIKFTSQGKNVYCNIKYDDSLEELYVEVIDEGIGIENEKLDKIFEAFSQADTSTTRKFGGTGLGLTISKKLVELLGGQLKIESKVGKGSKFLFTLPAKKTVCITKKEEEVGFDEDKITFSAKILIVEDNMANQMFFKVILKSLGIKEIEIANDGLEGIQKVKQNSYDIIFMDENMPNMNGLEATKKIKEMGIKTPIVAVTANALSGDKEKFLEIMDDYLAKPVEREKLIEILIKYIKGKND